MNDVICFDLNLSKTLDIADETLIGRKFFFAVVSPVLNSGERSAFLNALGKQTALNHRVRNFGYFTKS